MISRPLIFALSTILMFLNPGVKNEIFPYWIILIPFIRGISSKLFYSLLIILIFAFKGFLTYTYNFDLFTLDTIQFITVLVAFTLFYDMRIVERIKFGSYLRFFIWIQCGFMILQVFFPFALKLSAELFSGRPSGLVLQALLRNNAVIGFSPEPSYGSSLLVGSYFLLVLNKYSSRFLIIPVIISLLLFKSIYGFILFYSFGTLYFLYIKKYRLIVFSLNVLFFIIFIYLLSDFISTDRLSLFISSLIDGKSLQVAEQIVSPGSTRLDFLNLFIIDNNSLYYNKSISLGVYLLQIFGFIYFICFLFILAISKRESILVNAIILILFFFVTPMLIWPGALYLLSMLKLKNLKPYDDFRNRFRISN